MRLCTRKRHFDDGLTERIERFVLLPIVETEAIDVIDEGFSRSVLGQDQGMIIKLDMIIEPISKLLTGARSAINVG